MPRASIPLFERADGRKLVEQRCCERGVPVEVLENLLEEVIDRGWMQRAAGLWSEFDNILDTLVSANERGASKSDEREVSDDVPSSSRTP